jgi:hypothetical protein
MLKLQSDRFATQILYREKGREFVLGYIAEFPGQGVVKKYSKSDPHHMYKGFVHRYKATVDEVNWSSDWHTGSGAIRELLRHHGKDEIWGTNHIIPTPEMWSRDWKPIDYSKKLKKKK